MPRRFAPTMKHGSIAALLSIGALAWAQFTPVTPPPGSNRPGSASSERVPPTFSVKVNLVRLLVSARDNSGRVLTDLNKDDFRLADTGVQQDIAVFERNTSVPLSVAILIDTSGSTQQDLHYEEDSVLKFLAALLHSGNSDDTFALYSFNWRITQEMDFGRSRGRAEHLLHGLRGEGGTSLYDAIYLASDGLAQREGRHVMIVVTDGGDTTSYKHFGDALRAAQQADTVLYPIVVVPIENEAGRNIGGEHALATIASSTGGRIFNPDGFAGLDRAFSDVLRELRTQYLIGYYPKNVRQEPRLFHPVKVAVREGSQCSSAPGAATTISGSRESMRLEARGAIPISAKDYISECFALPHTGFRVAVLRRELFESTEIAQRCGRADIVIVRNVELSSRPVLIKTRHAVGVKTERSRLQHQIGKSLPSVMQGKAIWRSVMTKRLLGSHD